MFICNKKYVINALVYWIQEHSGSRKYMHTSPSFHVKCADLKTSPLLRTTALILQKLLSPNNSSINSQQMSSTSVSRKSAIVIAATLPRNPKLVCRFASQQAVSQSGMPNSSSPNVKLNRSIVCSFRSRLFVVAITSTNATRFVLVGGVVPSRLIFSMLIQFVVVFIYISATPVLALIDLFDC